MKALLLAGGRGTRLHPYTTIIPKPLMPVGNRPILEILLLQLRAVGIIEVIIAVGYLGHLLRAYFGDGSRLGIRLSYVDEVTPLGTAGPIGVAFDQLDDEFLLMNGDLLTTLNFEKLLQFHSQQGADATIGTYRREVKIDFGVLRIDREQRLLNYEEKPVLDYFVSMGVYVLNKKAVASFVRPARRIDTPELMLALLADQKRISCFQDDCYWLDIGRPDDYQLANEIIAQGKFAFPPEST
jgi:NDP-sugar pyrophosphorylase family protein